MDSTGVDYRKADIHTREREELQWFTCPSTLLVIVLNGLADGVMDDEAYVGLIYTHTKGHCGDHHLENSKHLLI